MKKGPVLISGFLISVLRKPMTESYSTSADAEEEITKAADELDRLEETDEMKRIGFNSRLFFLILPMSITSEQLTAMGLPVKPGMWAAAAPTGELMWSFVKSTMTGTMSKADDVTVSQKIILNAMLPLMKGKIVQKGRDISKVTVFASLAGQDPELTAEARVKLLEEFKDRHGFE